LLLPAATEVFPEITPGWTGNVQVVTVTASVLVGPAPQALFALTVMFPPAVPAVVEIEVVVEVPDHPEGSVQV
jgi:hypothetical protein